MVNELRKAGMDVRYGLPKEKAIDWFGTLVVSKDTKVMPSVYAFIDWVLDEKFATSMAKDFSYRMTTTAHMKNLTQKRSRISNSIISMLLSITSSFRSYPRTSTIGFGCGANSKARESLAAVGCRWQQSKGSSLAAAAGRKDALR